MIRQPIISKKKKKIFTARLYKINKGKKKLNSYMATVKRKFIESNDLEVGDGLLLYLKGNIFPTLLKKHGSKNYMYAFTIPSRIGRKVPLKTDFKLSFIEKNIKGSGKERKGFLNLANIVPSKTIRKNKLLIFDLENKLLFWIYSRGNKFYIFPKYVPLEKNNKNLLELFGFFLCEGFKARKENKHLDRLSFSNSEKYQIVWFLDAMRSLLNIKKVEWSCQILYSKNPKKKLKEYWSKVGLEKEKIKLIKNNTVKAKYGICILSIYNSTLAEVFYCLMEYCRDLSLKNKVNAIKAFRGASRGDLGVSSWSVSFDMERKANIKLLKKICKKINIRSSAIRFNSFKKGWYTFYITGKDNFEKILRLECMKHVKREKKLIKIFLKGNVLYKYLKSIKDGFRTSKKISSHLKLSIVTARHYLSKFRKQNYIDGKVINSKGKILYSLSTKGKNKWKFYQNLEKKLGDKYGS